MDSILNLQKKFKDAGLRLTRQRVLVYRYLSSAHHHPSAQQVYAELRQVTPKLSLATVYNTLDVLVEHGLVQHLGTAFDDTIHYDSDMEPHINLICTECHQIVDFPLDCRGFTIEKIAKSVGFKVSGSRIVYYGRCKNCLSKTI
jgi:Fur family peroxide stress response transcriptional regulator